MNKEDVAGLIYKEYETGPQYLSALDFARWPVN